MAAETGVSVNTLLSRKRYALLRLRDATVPPAPVTAGALPTAWRIGWPSVWASAGRP
jgi:hypothetical protein